MSYILDHHGFRLDNNSRNIKGKHPNIQTVNKLLLNNPWSQRKSSGKLIKYNELNETENIAHNHL